MSRQSSKFPIPTEFQAVVQYCPAKDTRTDSEILFMLSQHVPVTSERNVWAYWHSGLRSAPEWVQRNVCDWVRICGSSWTIRVLDKIPDSPNYVFKFVSPDVLPVCFCKDTMDGPFVAQHSSDFVRGACLYKYGGVWSDAGQILFMSFDRICWDKLEDPNTPYRVAAPMVSSVMVGNYFIAARKEDPFIKRWHEMFCTLWEKRTNYEGISEHPFFKNLGLDWNDDELFGDAFKFSLEIDSKTLFGYAAQMVCWARLCLLEGGVQDSFNGPEYWQKHMLLFGAFTETFGAEYTIGLSEGGPKIFNLLKSSLDADPTSESYKQAYKIVWRLLTESSTQKVASAKMLKTWSLGSLWNMPENRGKDREPGTFAELLRYGSVNFTQTRETPSYIKPQAPSKTFKKGYLEA